MMNLGQAYANMRESYTPKKCVRRSGVIEMNLIIRKNTGRRIKLRAKYAERSIKESELRCMD